MDIRGSITNTAWVPADDVVSSTSTGNKRLLEQLEGIYARDPRAA